MGPSLHSRRPPSLPVVSTLQHYKWVPIAQFGHHLASNNTSHASRRQIWRKEARRSFHRLYRKRSPLLGLTQDCDQIHGILWASLLLQWWMKYLRWYCRRRRSCPWYYRCFWALRCWKACTGSDARGIEELRVLSRFPQCICWRSVEWFPGSLHLCFDYITKCFRSQLGAEVARKLYSLQSLL